MVYESLENEDDVILLVFVLQESIVIRDGAEQYFVQRIVRVTCSDDVDLILIYFKILLQMIEGRHATKNLGRCFHSIP